MEWNGFPETKAKCRFGKIFLESKPSDLERFFWNPNLQIWKDFFGIQTFRFGKIFLESKPSDLERFFWNPNLQIWKDLILNDIIQI